MNYNSLNLKGTQKEIEEALADLEKTKEEKVIQTQPLFTLTAEEVIIVEHFLTCDKIQLETYEPSQENDIMIEDLSHILNKIKQWKDENNRTD